MLAVGPAQAYFHPPRLGLADALLNLASGGFAVVRVQVVGPLGVHVGPGPAGRLPREGVPLRADVGGAAHLIGGEGDDGQHFGLTAQAFVGRRHFGLQGLGLVAGPHLPGHVEAVGQHAGFLLAVQREEAVAVVPRFHLARGGVHELGALFVAEVGLAAGAHLVQQGQVALGGHFGQAFGHAAAGGGPRPH